MRVFGRHFSNIYDLFSSGEIGSCLFLSGQAAVKRRRRPAGRPRARTNNRSTQEGEKNFYSPPTKVRCVSQRIIGLLDQLDYVFGLTHRRTPSPAASASFHVCRADGAGGSGIVQRSPGPFQVKGVARRRRGEAEFVLPAPERRCKDSNQTSEPSRGVY